jgi:hypothetical protein
VKSLTTIMLLRLRHKLTVHARRERLLLAEEASALAFEAKAAEPKFVGDAAIELLEHTASGDLAGVARERLIAQARDRVSGTFSAAIEAHARARGEALARDHARVRTALPGASRVSVEPVLPVDIIGIFVVVPAGI